MERVLLLAPLLVLTLLGCERAGPDVGPEPPELGGSEAAPAEVRQGRIDSLVAFGSSFGMTRSELVHTLGQPPSVQSTPVTNRFDGSTDSSITWTYGGLEFQLQRAVRLDRDVMISVKLSGQVPDTPLPVWPGMKRDDVASRLGEGISGSDTRVVRYGKIGAEGVWDSVWIAYDESEHVDNIHWWYLP